MELLLPQHFFKYLLVIHLFLFVFASITVLRSQLSNFSKFILIFIALAVPILGEIIAFSMVGFKKKAIEVN